MRFTVGIDEVGRGPLAGPVSIGISVSNVSLAIPELNDSKKMTEAARERVYALASRGMASQELTFGVFSMSASSVDSLGIELCLSRLIARGLKKLVPDPSDVEVFLDGRLRAPAEYRQETVIGGDALIPAISLASVVAKVERDRFMVHVAEKYPGYGFEKHKGYGTAAHIGALRALGPSVMHRRSFLGNILGATIPA